MQGAQKNRQMDHRSRLPTGAYPAALGLSGTQGKGSQCLFTPPGRAETFLDPPGSRQGRGCECLDQQIRAAYLEMAGRSRVLQCRRAGPDGWEEAHPQLSYGSEQRSLLPGEDTPPPAAPVPGLGHQQSTDSGQPGGPSWASVMAASAVEHSGGRAVVPLESKDKEMAASTLSPVPWCLPCCLA